MDGAAGGVALQLRKLQHLHDNALADERSIAVNQDGNHALAFVVTQAVLLGADQAFDNRIDSFQMAGIEGDRHQHFSALGGLEDAAGAQVILDIAGALHAFRIRLAVEFGEYLRHRLADNIRQHVQAAAMRHADDSFVPVFIGGTFQHLVQNNDGAFQPFQAEALLSDEAILQEVFKLFGLNQSAQHAMPR